MGQQKSLGVVFVHNVFSVEFLWNRLPLYIVALYPALIMLAFELVRALGVFQRRGTVQGAFAVMLVHQCFYEVFDHLGPQRSWWLWNSASQANHPALAAVPLNSILLFATIAPGVLTGCAVAWSDRKGGAGLRSRRGFTGGVLVAGLAAPFAVVLAGVPGRIAGGAGSPDISAEAIVLSAMLAVALIIGSRAVGMTVWSRGAQGLEAMPRIMTASGLLFMVVFAVLWAGSLPQYFDAVHGVTTAGTRTGSLAYALVCYLACAVLLYLAYPRRQPLESS